MVVNRTAAVPLLHQLLADPIHLAPLLEVEGEVGASGAVVRAQQGDAFPAVGPLQIAPVVGIPGEP